MGIRINKPLVKVYSHPRSGTHFLEAFLAENFYSKQKNSFHTFNVVWGHWSNRKVNEKGNPFGKLFGNHYFPGTNNKEPKIYIIRDVRAVAYSIWNTDNFIHKDIAGISFEEFLRTKLDWEETPARKKESNLTIVEHWYKHVQLWEDSLLVDDNLLIVRYEDLVDNPYGVYSSIHEKFFKSKRKLKPEQVNPIAKPLGLLPNKGKKKSYEEKMNSSDLEFIFQFIPMGYKYLDH